jgi:hypothetical protein
MKIIKALLLVPLSFALPSQAMTWDDYQKRRSEREIKFYIGGVGAGYYYANNYLEAVGRARLYCQPAKEAIPGELYQEILEIYAASSGRRIEGVSVEVLLLAALRAAYPCK